MHLGSVSRERLHHARPDCIADVQDLDVGKVVIAFNVYRDYDGIINPHLTEVAVVTRSAYRILNSGVTDRGMSILGCMQAQKLPSYTRPWKYDEDSWVTVEGKGIDGIDRLDPPAGYSGGLLAVREEPYQTEPNLKVGPGLYINGANDIEMLFRGRFMAIALDSDPRLEGQIH